MATFEEMEAIAERVVKALKIGGLEAEYLKEDTVPGQDLMLAISVDGEDFSLALNLL